jgi:hypothetical protein
MAMSPVELGNKNSYAGEDQRQFSSQAVKNNQKFLARYLAHRLYEVN